MVGTLISFNTICPLIDDLAISPSRDLRGTSSAQSQALATTSTKAFGARDDYPLGNFYDDEPNDLLTKVRLGKSSAPPQSRNIGDNACMQGPSARVIGTATRTNKTVASRYATRIV